MNDYTIKYAVPGLPLQELTITGVAEIKIEDVLLNFICDGKPPTYLNKNYVIMATPKSLIAKPTIIV